jgi:hypothetical protein
LVWFGLVWFGLVWYCLVWFGFVCFGLFWFGLVWFGLVWFGLFWFGLVWFGIVWFGLGVPISCQVFITSYVLNPHEANGDIDTATINNNVPFEDAFLFYMQARQKYKDSLRADMTENRCVYCHKLGGISFTQEGSVYRAICRATGCFEIILDVAKARNIKHTYYSIKKN